MRMTFEEWFFSNKEKIIDLYNKETDPNYSCKVAYAHIIDLYNKETDPNYSCKVAYAHGETIQCKSSRIPNDKWENCIYEPEWEDDCEYRVKPKETE